MAYELLLNGGGGELRGIVLSQFASQWDNWKGISSSCVCVCIPQDIS